MDSGFRRNDEEGVGMWRITTRPGSSLTRVRAPVPAPATPAAGALSPPPPLRRLTPAAYKDEVTVGAGTDAGHLDLEVGDAVAVGVARQQTGRRRSSPAVPLKPAPPMKSKAWLPPVVVSASMVCRSILSFSGMADP